MAILKNFINIQYAINNGFNDNDLQASTERMSGKLVTFFPE
jgi:hypothetical protein